MEDMMNGSSETARGVAAPLDDPRIADLVQAGQIRLALFLPQYSTDADGGGLRGLGMGFVALELTRALAARLGVAMRTITLPTPPKALECLRTGACDLAFLGIEPSRAAQINFSPPVIQFDYSVLVPGGSSFRSIADVDRPGVRIAVVQNHASTFALTRMVKHAELVGAELPEAAFALLCEGKAQAFAAPRDHLLDHSDKLAGSHVLADGYGINNVGIAIGKEQPGRLAYISEFVEEAKASGLIAGIIARGGLRGFSVPR
jgi:polar amino acid transport system substrate-binding protein